MIGIGFVLGLLWTKPDEEITAKQIYQKTHHQNIQTVLEISDTFETCAVFKVAMMAALGAVAQHYIKFPGFDAGWQGRVEVARRRERSIRCQAGFPQDFCILDVCV